LQSSPLPERNLSDLARRLRLRQPGADAPLAPPPVEAPGAQRQFWLADQERKTYLSITATLRYVSAHLQIFVQNDIPADSAALAASAQTFETAVLPALRRYLGDPWSGGAGEPLITVLNARLPNRYIAGYYSESDTFPRLVNPYSNEREMIYLNSDAVRPGTRAYDAVLAHEFTHLLHGRLQRGQEGWLSEGLAMLGSEIAGFDNAGFPALFAANPDTQLNAWSDDPAQRGRHYGAALRFFRYYVQRAGGYAALADLLVPGLRGEAAFDHALALRGWDGGFEELFRDWVAALYLDPLGAADPRYRVGGDSVRARVAATVETVPERRSSMLPQFGTHYIELRLPDGSYRVTLAGNERVKLIAADPPSGQHMYVARRGDAANPRMTRLLDLSRTDRATLRFKVWYDLERDYDYAYVTISDDGGVTWRTLPGRYTTDTDPNGANFGHGYTGRSGAATAPPSARARELPPARWLDEEIDLTPYAGKQVLLRFEVVTDDAVNLEGFAVDEISVPEIGYTDDAESESGWQYEGLVRAANALPQRFIVQLIRLDSGPALFSVEQLTLDSSQQGSFTLTIGPGGTRSAVLVISAATRYTTQPAQYTLTVDRAA
jgi:immune inhibitor A